MGFLALPVPYGHELEAFSVQGIGTGVVNCNAGCESGELRKPLVPSQP